MTKQVFVGIDVHANTYSCTEVVDRKILKKHTIPANISNLINGLKNRYQDFDIRTVYEAGFCGFNLHFELTKVGINNIVVHPASIESNYKNKVKTDKIDSTKMAIQLSENRLKSIPIPTSQMQDVRDVTRVLTQLVSLRKKQMQMVRMKLHTYNLIPLNEKRVITLRMVDEFCENRLDVKNKILPLLSVWKCFNIEILELRHKVRKIDNESISLLKTIPGIGHYAAVVIYGELGEMQNFSSSKKLASYVGLTPSEYSSGDTIRKGRITKQGKPYLRFLLIQCAHIGRMKCPALKEKFTNISARANYNKAVVALARRMIIIARNLLKNRVEYKAIVIGEVRD